MYQDNVKTICLVLPSLATGGMERVMLNIADYLSHCPNISVQLVVFGRKDFHFEVPKGVLLHEPDKNYPKNKMLAFLYLLRFLRKTLRSMKPYSLLSFGSMYNSFVMIASLNMGIKIYLSDRSNPFRNSYLRFRKSTIERHDGLIHFILRKILYNKACGIIVQTDIAKEVALKTLRNRYVIKIPNPIREIACSNFQRERLILNVGRFIEIKQQAMLLEIFASIKDESWQLVFAGDGPELEKTEELARTLEIDQRVQFLGNTSQVDSLYQRCEIFAFTSISEGFPNALAEALNSSMAVISYDCVAGPSELIDDGVNGYLVPLNDRELYKIRLERLMIDPELRNQFRQNSTRKMREFDYDVVLNKFYKVLTA